MSKVCVKCGVELEDGAVFCDECGAKQIEQVVEPKMQNSVEKRANNETGNILAQMKNSGMGIASLIFGIISICTFGSFFIPEILGVVFGIVAISDKNSRHNLAVAGLVMSIISIVLFVALFAIGMTL